MTTPLLTHEADDAFKACKYCYRRIPNLYPFSWLRHACTGRISSDDPSRYGTESPAETPNSPHLTTTKPASTDIDLEA